MTYLRLPVPDHAGRAHEVFDYTIEDFEKDLATSELLREREKVARPE
jgi:hypothetical protein